MSGISQSRQEWTFPPDDLLASVDGRLEFRGAVVLVTLIGATIDVIVFGFPQTTVPYNYPFFVDIFQMTASVIILRRTYAGLQEVKLELMHLADQQLEDVSVGLETDVSPDRIQNEVDHILSWAYHPIVVCGGAVFGGSVVLVIMATLGVLGNYPYWVMNFIFGAAHGLFIGPAIGGFIYGGLIIRRYIVDINLLDPDGVGGYRRIGDTLVRIVSYGVFLVTLDFIILSSIAFTSAARFQQLIVALYLLELAVLIFGTVFVTLSIRSKLLEIRDVKVNLIQKEFTQLEHKYWQKHDEGLDNQSEAIQLMVMTTMFNEINRMNMWPVNLYSLVRLGSTIGFSLVVFVSDTLGLLSGTLPLPFGF